MQDQPLVRSGSRNPLLCPQGDVLNIPGTPPPSSSAEHRITHLYWDRELGHSQLIPGRGALEGGCSGCVVRSMCRGEWETLRAPTAVRMSWWIPRARSFGAPWRRVARSVGAGTPRPGLSRPESADMFCAPFSPENFFILQPVLWLCALEEWGFSRILASGHGWESVQWRSAGFAV